MVYSAQVNGIGSKKIRSLSAPYFNIGDLLVLIHGFQHLVRRFLLFRCEVDPVFKQLFEFRADFDHLALGKELCHRDAESLTDCFQRCEGGDCIPPINISNRGLG